ncbi:MAG: hypothetical protein HYU99_06110 [Deltaproteobacteria bacterium]|nr:hypothetical protein [Deltaproteobacteria bacterium]
MKTLTVSIALGAHEPVRTEADIDRFAKTEDAVNEALKDIKEKTWPDKGGLASASFDDPMPKNPAPPLSNGSLNGIAGLLVLGLTGFSQPEIGAVQSAVSYDHPVPVSAPFTGNLGSAPLAGLTAFAALPSVWTVGIPLTAAIPYTPSAAFPAFAL